MLIRWLQTLSKSSGRNGGSCWKQARWQMCAWQQCRQFPWDCNPLWSGGEGRTWPGITSSPCMKSQHIFHFAWPLSRRGQVWPWFNTLRNGTSADHQLFFCPWSISVGLSQYPWSHSLTLWFKSCSSSPLRGQDQIPTVLSESCLSQVLPMPFLGFEIQNNVQKNRVCSGWLD